MICSTLQLSLPLRSRYLRLLQGQRAASSSRLHSAQGESTHTLSNADMVTTADTPGTE